MSNTKHTKPVIPASSEVLLHLLETLSGALFVVDDDARIIYANAGARALAGATQEEVLGTSLWRCVPSLISTSLYQAVQKIKHTHEPTDVAYVSPVTSMRWHVSLSPISDGLALFFQDQREPMSLQEEGRKNEPRYQDLLESFADSVTILTPDGLILDLNQRSLADAHLRREEVIGTPFSDLPAWSSDPVAQQPLRKAIARASTGETVRFEARIHHRTDLLMTITSHRDANQRVEYLICAGRDITECKRAEDELHTLLDAIPHFMWIIRPDGSVAYINQRGCDYTGKTLEQIQRDGWLQFIHPDDQSYIQQVWHVAVRTGAPYEGEHRIQQGCTGAYRWFLARSIPYRDAQGTILYWVGTCTDIEEQKRAEQQLKESRENWHVLIETMPQIVWIGPPSGAKDYFNQRWFDYTHATHEQVQGAGWLQFLHPDDYERTLALGRHAIETGEPYEMENRFREGQTGIYRWFLSRAMPMRDDTGRIVKWFGTCTDIEEQKQAEQQLKESRESLRVLAETVPQLVWVKRPNGWHEYVNRRCCDYTGLTLEQIQSERWDYLQIVHPDDREQNRAHWQHALDTGNMFEYRARLRHGQTGEYRWFLSRAMPVRDDTGQIIKWVGTSTDIEDQVRIEEALRQSQERIRALVSSNIIGITSVEIEGEVFVDANEAFLRMTGYTREDVQSRMLTRARILAPEDAPLFERAIQAIATCGQHTPFEAELVCKDGSHLPVLVGGVLYQEHPRQIVGFVLDNSARKELEQRKDDFISMASHELRNPLAALKLQTTLLYRQLARQGTLDQAPALSRMETQLKTITRLVEELLDVSKIQAGKLEYRQETVDLDALLREIVETMQHIHPSHTLLVRGAAQVSLIGDRDRLGQVFTNLISNAIKYSPGAAMVEMDLTTSEDVVTVRVRDHGLGIPREQRDKIFDRFYRVSGPKQKAIPGLGMGLYIVAEIVKRHGGTITVDSAVGKGSTFTVTLPKKRNT